MDQNLLLTAERLTLNTDLVRGWTAHRRLVIKHLPTQNYLAISLEQDLILRAFANPSTVPEVLGRMLAQRTCLPLREFYELILKAYKVGILKSVHSIHPSRYAVSWPSVKGGWVPKFTGALNLIVLAWIAAVPPTITTQLSANLLSLFLGLNALSLGQLLAASVLKAADGEIYMRSTWRAWVRLYFRFDLRDIQLLKPNEQRAVLLAEVLPITLLLVGFLMGKPTWALPLIAVWLFAWRPWGKELVPSLMNLLSRCPTLDSDNDFIFNPNHRPQLHWRPWWVRWDLPICALHVSLAILWTAVVARVLLQALDVSFDEIAFKEVSWLAVLQVIVGTLLLIIMAVMVNRWKAVLRIVLGEQWRNAKGIWKRWRHGELSFTDHTVLQRLAAGNVLLKGLTPYEQATIVKAWKLKDFTALTTLCEEGTEPDEVGLIVSGEAALLRKGVSGRKVQALRLLEGDFFGLPTLTQPMDALLEIRSRSPLSALMLPMTVFKETVINRLGRENTYNLGHKYVFLKRLHLCDHWDPLALVRFAQLTQIATYKDNDYILEEKVMTNWFYILYEGYAQVRRQGRLVARLKPGDYFGEISLLQNSATVAEVVAQGTVRCLQIERNGFMRFMTHNHHVALQLEKISSQRLGHPIFPLK